MRLLPLALALVVAGCAYEDPYAEGYEAGRAAERLASWRQPPTRELLRGQLPLGELRATPDTTDAARLPQSPRDLVFEVWSSDPATVRYQVELDHARWLSVHEDAAGPGVSPLRWTPDAALCDVMRGRSVRVILDRQTAESDSGSAWALVYLITEAPNP